MSRVEKNKKNKILKYSIGSIVLISIVILIAIAYKVSLLNDVAQDISVVEGNNTVGINDEFVNILVMGVDVGTPEEPSANKRTDTIILLNYNDEISKVNMISIPRDTYIKLNGKNSKINAANVYGGVSTLVEAVEKMFDINIAYYVKVDYSGFRKIVDAIGGVDMQITRNMFYDDDTQDLHIRFNKGDDVHLDGKKAEQFVRWRKNNDNTGLSNGDIGRISNQQIFMNKVIEKIKSPQIITKLPSILNVVPEFVETNMNLDEIIKYGNKFAREVNIESIDMMTLKGESRYINDISYYIYDQNMNSDILKMIHDDEYSVINKSGFKINILNGTNKTGLSKNFAEYIKGIGYKNSTLGNTENTNTTKVCFYGIDDKYIETIENDLNLQNISIYPEKQGEYDIVIILGDDHDYIKK